MSEANTTQAQANEQPQGLDLTIQDLAGLRTVIDVASQRGAFKPGEMVHVGTVYNKLAAFLDAVAKQQQAQQASEEKAGE